MQVGRLWSRDKRSLTKGTVNDKLAFVGLSVLKKVIQNASYQIMLTVK